MLRIMLVDDHAVVRAGFRRLLEQQGTMDVVAETASGEAVYADWLRTRPHVVVMDLSLPGMSGLEATRHLLTRQPDARVLVFSMHEDATLAERALAIGAGGYVTKVSAPEVLVDAVQALAAGQRYVSPDIEQALTRLRPEGDSPLRALSPREFEIFRMWARGMPATEIAGSLCLSGKTIANYHTQIRQKLRAANDVELVHLARQLRLV